VKKSWLFSTSPVIKHSLATPLANILLNTEIAVNNIDSNNNSAVYLRRVLLNARYLESILKLSESSSPQPFSPKKALSELIVLNEGSKLKKHLITRTFLPKELSLLGSKLAFQEIITCLLNNAYESYRTKAKQRVIFLSALLKNQLLELSVIDGGQGMTWLTKKLSVNPLYSTKNNHSGLGLYFVKKTLEQEFSGSFLLDSKVGRGTKVTLLFPLKRNQKIAKPSPSLYDRLIRT
jgi:signal transduction histidine kinase